MINKEKFEQVKHTGEIVIAALIVVAFAAFVLYFMLKGMFPEAWENTNPQVSRVAVTPVLIPMPDDSTVDCVVNSEFITCDWANRS